MPNTIQAKGIHFTESSTQRTLTLRGVNLSGSTKMGFQNNTLITTHTPMPADHRTISFVNILSTHFLISKVGGPTFSLGRSNSTLCSVKAVGNNTPE